MTHDICPYCDALRGEKHSATCPVSRSIQILQVDEGVRLFETLPMMPAPAGPFRYECTDPLPHVHFTPPDMPSMLLPADPAERKALPIATGVFDYFPLALAEVARVSKAGNDQHNPGQPLHWDRTKSLDHADCIARHLIDRGSLDADGMRHSAKLVWRALALLQTELENTTKGNP